MKFSKKIKKIAKRLRRIGAAALVFLLIFVIPVSAADAPEGWRSYILRTNQVFGSTLYYEVSSHEFSNEALGQDYGWQWIVEDSAWQFDQYLKTFMRIDLKFGEQFTFKFLNSGGRGNDGWSGAALDVITFHVTFVAHDGFVYQYSVLYPIGSVAGSGYSLKDIQFVFNAPTTGHIETMYLSYSFVPPGRRTSFSLNFGDIYIGWGAPSSPEAPSYDDGQVAKGFLDEYATYERQQMNSAVDDVHSASGSALSALSSFFTAFGNQLTACTSALEYLWKGDTLHPKTIIYNLLLISLGVALIPILVGIGIRAGSKADHINKGD